MIPIRILLVEDARPFLNGLKEELEASGNFEVSCATSSGAGMLGLARIQPDLLVVNPYAGRGTVEAWRRVLGRYRTSRPLGVIALAHRPSARDRVLLGELADLGIFPRGASVPRLCGVLSHWANAERLLARAA